MRFTHFSRSVPALVVAVALAWVTGCGGATSAPAKQGGTSSNDMGSSAGIGEAMAAQGGTSALASSASSGSTPLAGSLRAELLLRDQKVKLDGVPLEWPARTAATTTVKGPTKSKFTGGIQYDNDKIYVAGEITDPSFAEGRSHASLMLAFPSGGSFVGYEVILAPGKPGETAGSVKLRGQAIGGGKIVEAPTDAGLTFEAVIPWSTFPEAARLRVGLRGALRYTDAAGGVVATGDGDASDAKRLPSLPTEPEQALIEGLLVPKNLTHEVPKFELYADVIGDAMKERITVWGSFFTVCGPGYRDGKEYFFRDLSSGTSGADLVQLDAREVTGRGKSDLLIRRRYATKTGARENFEVWSFLNPSGEPTTTFAQEILVQEGTKKVTNSVHVGAKAIDIATAPAVGWDVNSYREPAASDVEPILLPWGTVKSRSFRWSGDKFTRDSEVAQAGQAPTTPPASATPTSTIARTEPATPPQRKGGDLGKQMLDQFKKDRGIDITTKPKTDIEVNVAEDARPERVVVLGRDVVVFGPGYKNGASYTYLTLTQFESESDVREVTTRDLTGDGAADVVVRGVRRVNAQGSSGPVEMETLFVYAVQNGALVRVFGIETAREVGSKRVQGLVQFVPANSGKGFDVDVRPGRAAGWTEKTYPWGQDQPGTGSLEPLLLPWGGISALHYSWDGAKFSAR